MADCIKVGGSVTKVSPANGSHFMLEELQKYVGGYIEPIRFPDGRVMLVNEEGLIHSLLFNHTASILTGRRLVGDVIILTKQEWKECNNAK